MTSYMNEEIYGISNMLLTLENSNQHIPDEILLDILNERFQKTLIKLYWFSEKMTEIEEERLFYFKDEKRAIVEFLKTY